MRRRILLCFCLGGAVIAMGCSVEPVEEPEVGEVAEAPQDGELGMVEQAVGGCMSPDKQVLFGWRCDPTAQYEKAGGGSASCASICVNQDQEDGTVDNWTSFDCTGHGYCAETAGSGGGECEWVFETSAHCANPGGGKFWAGIECWTRELGKVDDGNGVLHDIYNCEDAGNGADHIICSADLPCDCATVGQNGLVNCVDVKDQSISLCSINEDVAPMVETCQSGYIIADDCENGWIEVCFDPFSNNEWNSGASLHLGGPGGEYVGNWGIPATCDVTNESICLTTGQSWRAYYGNRRGVGGQGLQPL